MATGHYARRLVDETADGPRARLAAAADTAKDQTYFLYGLRQDQLWHSRFPLGDLTKPEVRAVARSLGLVTADKPESQEICFVPGGDYRAELRSRGGWVPEPGPVVDVDGRTVGEHAGAAGFTVGQRKGLGVALGEPRFVARVDAVANTIILGHRRDLETRRVVYRGRLVHRGRTPGRPRRERVVAPVPRVSPDPAPRDARRGHGAAGNRRRAGPRRPLDRRDGHAGVGGRAGAGMRPVRR